MSNLKIPVFCVQQLDEVLAICKKEADEIAELCDASLDNQFTEEIMVSVFHQRYYLSPEMKVVVGEDDALCNAPEEL